MIKASALQTFVAVVAGAYVLGQEGQPLELTEQQAAELVRDGVVVLAEGEKPKVAQPKVKVEGGAL